MTRSKYTAMGSSPSPVPYNNMEKANFDATVSSDVATKYLIFMKDLIDERINKRLLQEDIAKIYVGKIVSMELSNKYLVFATKSGTTMTDAPEQIASSITVEYNDKQTVTISNHSARSLTSSDNGKYVKICTYDGIQFYFLHLM